MINENTRVRTLVRKEEYPIGTVGVVVSVYSSGVACEVEIWGKDEYPVDVVTYLFSELKEINSDDKKRKADYTFYAGYEGEKEVVITSMGTSFHIWDGYFEDIFGNLISTNGGWSGFTRDYNEFVNAFDDECIECAIPSKEYLEDAILYINAKFSYEETKDVLKDLIRIFTEAIELNECVFVKVN